MPGMVGSYVHANGKLAALVELKCETEFAARSEHVATFARDLALHIAAASPQWISEADVPAPAQAEELRIARARLGDGRGAAHEREAQRRVQQWLNEAVLLNQPHVNDAAYQGKTIDELRARISALVGEPVVIRRFARFHVGD